GIPLGFTRHAIELIASHQKKFLSCRSITPIFYMNVMGHMPPHQSWGSPQGLPPNAGGGPGFEPSP
ncbi:hypothetical protein HN873_033333, partial [Arachis hypogaea]